MSFLSPDETSDHAVDRDDVDNRACPPLVEYGPSQLYDKYGTKMTRGRREKLLLDLDGGRFRPIIVPPLRLGDREHIIRENKARYKIEFGNTQASYHIASTQPSPRSLCENPEISSFLGLSDEYIRHRASIIGLRSSSPSKHSPSPSPESEANESREDFEYMYGRREIDIDGTLCALCRQINVEVLVGGFTHYLLSELAISSHSCKLCYIWMQKITSSMWNPFDPKFRYSRVKLDVRSFYLWDEKTGEQYVSM